jgi:hypothetical protein
MVESTIQLQATYENLSRQYPNLAAKWAGGELFGAPRLNAFSLFNPNEVRLTRVIADLFDPRGTHGQNILFLNALLSALKLPRVNVLDPITVRREMVTTEGRQIDLVIEMPHLLLGLENKPWAGQQPSQLADYLTTLKGWAADRKPILVFLSNKQPETAKSDVTILRLCSDEEESLSNILSRSLPEIKAYRTKIHVEEMLAYLAAEFGDEEMSDEANSTFIEAVEAEYERGPESRRAIAMTMVAHSELHTLLLSEISQAILSAAQSVFPDFEEEDEDYSLKDCLIDRHDCWAIRRPAWPENCSIALAGAKTGYSRIYFGVLAPDGTSEKVDDELGCSAHKKVVKAVRKIEGGSKSVDYPWWKYADPDDWSAASLAGLLLQSPTGQIVDSPRVKDLIDRMVALAKVVDEGLRR